MSVRAPAGPDNNPLRAARTARHAPPKRLVRLGAMALGAAWLVATMSTPAAAPAAPGVAPMTSGVAAEAPVIAAGTVSAAAAADVEPGIDVWVADGFAPLAGKRIGLITNLTGRDARGRLTAEILAAATAIDLVAIFSPEHGFAAALEGDVDHDVDQRTGLPIYSLYGETRRPTPEMLDEIEGLVFDIQDIGTRFYTYATTLAYAMEEAAAHDLPVVVLDRPNPITGRDVAGPVLDENGLSFVGYAPIPIRHGMTIGELARYFNGERGIGAELTVVRMRGWRRVAWFDETGLLWFDPSPNIRNLTQALLYPAVGPLETTNVSVGRGTDAPFEWFGAPWLDGQALAARLNAADLPGVRFVPRRLTPDASVHAGVECGGVNLIVTARDAFDAGLTAATLAVELSRTHPDEWDRARFLRLWGDPAIEEQLNAGEDPAAIVDSWSDAHAEFRRARQRYLLYE